MHIKHKDEHEPENNRHDGEGYELDHGSHQRLPEVEAFWIVTTIDVDRADPGPNSRDQYQQR